jgi:hypothetical protein
MSLNAVLAITCATGGGISLVLGAISRRRRRPPA